MKKSDATTGNGVTEENPVTRLMETVSKIIEFAEENRHEPKRIVERSGTPNPLITLEFPYSKSRDEQRLKLAKEFGNRLQACKARFHQAGEESKTIREWSDRLQEPVQALLYFEESFRQKYAKRASIGLATLPKTAVADFVGRKIGEVASARQPFQEMEDILRPVPSFVPIEPPPGQNSVTRDLPRSGLSQMESLTANQSEQSKAKTQVDKAPPVQAQAHQQKVNEPPNELLDALTGQQVKLLTFLWTMPHGVSWDILPREAFRAEDNRQDGSVKRALERLQKKLNEFYERFHVGIEINAETRRVKLEKPSQTTPDK